MYTEEELSKMTCEELRQEIEKAFKKIDEDRTAWFASPQYKELYDNVMELKSLRKKHN